MSAAANERRHVPVAILGHCDCGKATIVRRLRTLQRSPGPGNRIRDDDDVLGLDELEEGLARWSRAVGPFRDAIFHLVNSPGRRGYVFEALLSLAMCDVCCLVVSARQGEFEAGLDRFSGGTRSALQCAAFLLENRRKIVVAVTKLDTVPQEQRVERLEEVCGEIRRMLRRYGRSSEVVFVPVVAVGDSTRSNLVTADCKAMGLSNSADFPSLMESLRSAVDDAPDGGPVVDESRLRVLCDDVRFRDDGASVTGRVFGKTICSGDTISMTGIMIPERGEAIGDATQFVPDTAELVVQTLRTRDGEVEEACHGQFVSARLGGSSSDLLRTRFASDGIVLSEHDRNRACPSAAFTVRGQFMKALADAASACNGRSVRIVVGGSIATARFEGLVNISAKKAGTDAAVGDAFEARVEPEHPIVVDESPLLTTLNESPLLTTLNRGAVLDGGHIIAFFQIMSAGHGEGRFTKSAGKC
jgi:translation elongation factor EF-1alpha